MKPKKIFLTFLVLIGIGATTKSQTLDQSQLLSNSGISARTLSGYSIFQSFTCGITGKLTEIDLGVFNYINGSGTLQIYSGGNNLGPLLQSIPVNVYCASGNCLANFSTSVLVTAGQVYTFLFTPGIGIPDPYGVLAQVPGNYSGGQFGLIDPSGTYYPGWDLVFKTYVNSQLGIRTLDYDSTSLKIYPNPCSSITNLHINKPLNNATLTLFNLYGQQIKQLKNLSEQEFTLNRENVASGIYFVQIIENEKLIATEKLVITD
jgi:hypothetical protein